MTNTTTLKKSRFAVTAISAMMAMTIGTLAFVPNADAGRRERLFLGGVAAGIVGTAIIANEVRRNREHREYRETRWERHVRRCYAAYRSYDESTDTYINNYGEERRCRK